MDDVSSSADFVELDDPLASVQTRKQRFSGRPGTSQYETIRLSRRWDDGLGSAAMVLSLHCPHLHEGAAPTSSSHPSRVSRFEVYLARIHPQLEKLRFGIVRTRPMTEE